MADIFLSYAREDLEIARQLAVPLEAQGWSVFWDRTIPAGKTWRDVIGRALKEARCIVVAWSSASVGSRWVLEEAEDGLERDILVPILLEHVDLPLGFRSLQAADLVEWTGAEESVQFQQLVRDMTMLLGTPPRKQEVADRAELTEARDERRGEEKKPRQEGLLQESEVALPPTYTNSIGMEFVLIPAGTFEMGSNEGDEHERPVHTVEISRPFYLGRTAVTQAHWEAVMETTPWKGKTFVKEGPDFPATCVSWNDAKNFVKALSKREKGKTYRLPTEAEWEYAARAGEGDDYGKDVDQVAWYRENAWDVGERYSHRVAQKNPNAWGLYDMLGGVWEWVEDWYGEDYYAVSPPVDPKGPDTSGARVLRGGSFYYGACDARLSRRYGYRPNYRGSDGGFRVLLLPFSEL